MGGDELYDDFYVVRNNPHGLAILFYFVFVFIPLFRLSILLASCSTGGLLSVYKHGRMGARETL